MSNAHEDTGGGIRRFIEDNRVSTNVSSLKGTYDASTPQEEEIESHVDGVNSAEIKIVDLCIQ